MGPAPRQSGFRCYHCGSPETCKAGFSKFGQTKKQRFFCRGCHRYFRENPKYIEGTTDKRNFWVRKNLPSAGYLILELQAISQNVLRRTPKAADITELSKQNRSNSLNTYSAVFGTFREALRRARLTPDYPKPVNRETMLEELRALRKRLNRPLTKIDVVTAWKKGKAPSPYFLKREFGSLTEGLAAAGAGRKKYSRQELIDFLRKLDARIEVRVEKRHVNKLFRKAEGPSYDAFRTEFGSLETARKVARINWRRAAVKYSSEELIEQLRSLGKKIGRKPTSRDIGAASKLGECACVSVFANMFGGLAAAYRAAGFFEIEHAARKYTDKEILSAIRELWKEFGRMPTSREIAAASRQRKCPGPGTIIRRIGKLTDLRS